MTIPTAVEEYRKNGEGSVSPAFRAIVNQLIDDNVKTEFANDSYLDALYLTDVMFHRANKSIRLLTGPGCARFLSTLEDSFLSALNRLANVGGEIKLILLSNEIPQWLKSLIENHPRTLKVRQAKAEEPLNHFIVCDSRILRYEQIHDAITEDTPATAIKARVAFNDPAKAQVLESIFDQMWNSIAAYSVNQCSQQ